MNGIDTVLNFPAAPAGRLRSVVLLTDGLIGDDEQIIAEIRDRLKPGNRLYSFGVGSSTNRFLIEEVRGNGAIAQLWGRARIKALMNQMYGRETPEVVEAVTDTALNYRLMSKYTSFVAVTEEIRVDSKDGKKVDVPVETPEGMDNQGTDTPSSGNTASVPEPDQIIGNLFTLLLLIVVFGIKPLKKVIIKIRS